jgi:type II secretory ATPase GspE/PulE/Tfp pilus assembly ATPase PilB-like protein
MCSLATSSNRPCLRGDASQRNCRYTFARGRQGIFEALSEALVISEEMERCIQDIARRERSQDVQNQELQNVEASGDANGEEGSN